MPNDRVAIVLATHEPDRRLLRAQMDSLIRQTHKNWTCWITDDGSSEQTRQDILTEASRDSRFEVLPRGPRLGCYLNFERGLKRVPADVAYVSYCDQDDEWHPQKIHRLVEALENHPRAQLVHSDLEVVGPSGEVLFPSCWRAERRNTEVYKPELLLMRNTVTGCALLFRRELLELILPFPVLRVGQPMLHDLWTALVASSVGEIVGVSEPLVRYTQHAGNLVGVSAGRTETPTVSEGLFSRVRFKIRNAQAEWQWRAEVYRALEERWITRWPPTGNKESRPRSLRPGSLLLESLRSGYHANWIALRLVVGKAAASVL